MEEVSEDMVTARTVFWARCLLAGVPCLCHMDAPDSLFFRQSSGSPGAGASISLTRLVPSVISQGVRARTTAFLLLK